MCTMPVHGATRPKRVFQVPAGKQEKASERARERETRTDKEREERERRREEGKRKKKKKEVRGRQRIGKEEEGGKVCHPWGPRPQW